MSILTLPKVIILDRDGTLVPKLHYLVHPDQLELIPYVGKSLQSIQKLGIKFVIATNQSVIERGIISEFELQCIHDKLLHLLQFFNVSIEKIFFCPHKPNSKCECRKPRAGMGWKILKYFNCNPEDIWVIGDQESDMQFAKNISAFGVLLTENNLKNYDSLADVNFSNWFEIEDFIVRLSNEL
jgi:histidinol-phosphate phosphatase family protein